MSESSPEFKFLIFWSIIVLTIILAASPNSFPAALVFGATLSLLGFIRWVQLLERRDDGKADTEIKELRSRIENLEMTTHLKRSL